MTKRYYCNFCGKDDTQVNQLVAGPEVFICNECIDQCADIINPQKLGAKEYDSWSFDIHGEGLK